LLLGALARRHGYDLRHYRMPLLTRRARIAMIHERAETLAALSERVLVDPESAKRVVRCLTVHATAMFRDPEFYLAFRHYVVPLLRRRSYVRIWHAGCSTGEEVYSLAILLCEEGLLQRCRIYATDSCGELLAHASLGRFFVDNMPSYAKDYERAGGRRPLSDHYAVEGEHAVFNPALRRGVVFARHNLATDGTFNEFDVILCRNVLIYFDDLLKNRAHELLWSSLAPAGVLGLGSRESIRFTPRAGGYHELAGKAPLWKRIG
jgi:chemotaxis protein methyltransferase CheR